MCGFAGALASDGQDLRDAVRRMNDRLRLRGPDAEGLWHEPESGACLANRRLAIIDLDPRANQPFHSADGRHVIAYNGEIYNYRDIREELIAAGVALRTTSDTEAILELVRLRGADALRSLRGMFAFAIWDRVERRMLLARDPYGIKPLYLAHTAKGLLFSSQVKSILASGLVGAEVDPAGLVGFHLWGSVPEPFTIYRGIRPVPAGCYVMADARGVSAPQRFANIANSFVSGASDGDIVDVVRAALTDSVRAHIVSDVPVAVLLSGGMDSSTIAGLMVEQGQKTESVTVAFREFAGSAQDETVRSRLTAKAFGIENTVRNVTLAEFEGDLPAILDAMDQPSIDGVNTWFASKAVAERGYKVVLSGIGGDELFGGYSSFQTVPQAYRVGRMLNASGAVRRVTQPAFDLGARWLNQPKLAHLPRLAGTFSGAYLLRRGLMMPDELEHVLPRSIVREGLAALAGAEDEATAAEPLLSGDPVACVAAYESTRYLRNQLLRDSDWASMAHSLELRTPIVDWTLLQTLGPRIAESARIGRSSLFYSALKVPLPKTVTSAPKTGFGIPMRQWLDALNLKGDVAPGDHAVPWARRWLGVVGHGFNLEPETAAA